MDLYIWRPTVTLLKHAHFFRHLSASRALGIVEIEQRHQEILIMSKFPC